MRVPLVSGNAMVVWKCVVVSDALSRGDHPALPPASSTKAEALSVKLAVERESTSHTPTYSHPTTPRCCTSPDLVAQLGRARRIP
jgi:hypothetical protein